jgi:hypothetical protein
MYTHVHTCTLMYKWLSDADGLVLDHDGDAEAMV